MKLGLTIPVALVALSPYVHAQVDAPADGQADSSGDQQSEQMSEPAPSESLATIPVDPLGSEPTQPESEPSRPSARGIEEVVVTATKRDETVRKIPFTIDAMKGEDLVEKGATNLDEILKRSPGVSISGSRINVRGVALTAQQSLLSGQETGRFLGDISLNAPSTQGGIGDFDPYDMATVEVLKGPQSTLFGGTALSGAVRYVPNKPKMGNLGGSVRMGYGDIGYADDPLKEVSGMLNVPVLDGLAFRAAGTFRDKPNVVDDLYGGREDNDSYQVRQARYMARWEATERLSFDITYLDYAFDNNFSFLDSDERPETSVKRVHEPLNSTVEAQGLNVQYAFDAFTVVGLVSRLKSGEYFLLDASPVLGTSDAGAVPLIINLSVDMPSYELRIVSNEPSDSSWALLNNWDYLAGIYYMDADQYVNQLTTYNGVAISETDAYVYAEEKALFVNLTRRFVDDKLVWNMGARAAETALDIDTVVSYLGVPRSFPAKQPESRINPSFALTWNFNDDVSLRGSYADGFRFGGGNTATTIGIEDIPASYKSDSLSTYEIALRSDWFDKSLRFDITPFLIDWSDLQLTQISPSGYSYTANVGGAIIKGIETQLIWQIPDDWALVPSGLTLNLGYAYLNAKTTEDFSSANGDAPKGSRLPLSSKNSGAIGLSWQHAWNALDFSSSMQANFASDRPNDLIESRRLPSYHTLSASFRVANLAWPGSPALSLTGTNLTNEFILYNATQVTASPGDFVYVMQGLPRTVKLSLDFMF